MLCMYRHTSKQTIWMLFNISISSSCCYDNVEQFPWHLFICSFSFLLWFTDSYSHFFFGVVDGFFLHCSRLFVHVHVHYCVCSTLSLLLLLPLFTQYFSRYCTTAISTAAGFGCAKTVTVYCYCLFYSSLSVEWVFFTTDTEFSASNNKRTNTNTHTVFKCPVLYSCIG